MSAASEGPRPDGSAEQANALLTAVTDWVARAMPGPPSGRPGPECQWCPLCQLASVLRGDHPELTDRLLEAGEAVSTALQVLGQSAAQPPTRDAASSQDGGAGQPPAPAAASAPATARPGGRPRPRPGPGGPAGARHQQ